MEPQEILDALGTAVLVLNAQLRVVAANSAALDLFGVGASQAAGRPLAELVEAPEPLQRIVLKARESVGTCAQRELSLQAASGGEAHIVDVFVTSLNADPARRTLVVELTDAAQRRRISRDAALLAQLDGGRLMARQLAHEIKNPLGGVRGAAQLLARQLGDTTLREYTQVIINEADRLAALVDSMLGPARPPHKESLNLHELCEHLFHLLRSEASPGIVLERDYDPSLPDAALDRNMIVQAMLNLGRNALQAASRSTGSGRVVLRTRALHNQNIGTVRHRLVSSVQFEDNGPGVPAEIRDTLFYPLVTGREGGSGLGLAVAQDLVTRHGGLIEFESVPGRTQFNILLPVIS